MIITLLQQDIVWGNPSANQKAAEGAMLAADKSDLYVLPEMWSTGFATEPERYRRERWLVAQLMKQMANLLDAGSGRKHCHRD